MAFNKFSVAVQRPAVVDKLALKNVVVAEEDEEIEVSEEELAEEDEQDEAVKKESSDAPSSR